MIERTIQTGNRVIENKPGIYGHVKRCLWLVDLKTQTPAIAACIVRFDDGREVQRTEDQITYVRRLTTYID
jgi:hypothetical protein